MSLGEGNGMRSNRRQQRKVTASRFRAGRVTGVWLALFAAGSSVAAQQADSAANAGEMPVSNAEFAISVSAETASAVERMIRQLGSPRYEERAAATTGLLNIGAGAFKQLREAYNETSDLEVRIRIERLVHEAYLDHHVFGVTGPGFLGISRGRQAPSHGEDERIPRGAYGIQIQQVIEHTAAERAGLEVSDVIVSLDGETFSGGIQQAFASFSERIRDSGAGTEVLLVVLRGEETLEVKVRLGSMPKDRLNQISGLAKLVREANDNFARWWVDYFRATQRP